MITFEDFENKALAPWIVYSEGRHLAWAQTGCLQEGRLAPSVVADGRVDLQREHEWFRAAADLCEITRPRNMDGSFESEFFF